MLEHAKRTGDAMQTATIGLCIRTQLLAVDIILTSQSIGVAKRLRPEHIEFIDAIPMTESGKVKRHQLADELDRRLKERAE